MFNIIKLHCSSSVPYLAEMHRNVVAHRFYFYLSIYIAPSDNLSKNLAATVDYFYCARGVLFKGAI